MDNGREWSGMGVNGCENTWKWLGMDGNWGLSGKGCVFWLLNYNQNLSHPPGPHVTQGPGIVHQPGTDIGQSRSTGPHSTQGPNTCLGQTKVSPRSTGPPYHRVVSSPRSIVIPKTNKSVQRFFLKQI